MPSDAFNAYHKWLGIPPAEQPPNHYRLLGISAFENDPEVIDRAADGRMIFLRQNQSGPNRHWSQLLLNEVSAARICLLDESTKQRYDEWLRDLLDPDLVPLKTAVSMMVPETGRFALPGHDPLATKPKPTAQKPLLVALAVGGTVAVSGLVALGLLLSVHSNRPDDTSASLVTRPAVANSRGLPPLPPQENEALQRVASSGQTGIVPGAVKNTTSNLPPGWSAEVAALAPPGDARTESGTSPTVSVGQHQSATAKSTVPVAAPDIVAPSAAAVPALQPAPTSPVNSTPFIPIAAKVSQPATGAQARGLAQPGVVPQPGPAPPGVQANPIAPVAPQLPGTQGQSTAPMMGPMRGMPPSGGFMPPFGPPPGFMPPFGAPGQMPGGQPGQPTIPGQPGFVGGPFSSPRTDVSAPPLDTSPVPPATLDDVVATLKAQDKSPQEVYNRLRALLHLPHDSSRRTEVAALLDPLLISENATVRTKARELMQTWGTEVNAPTLINLLSVQDRFDRHDAIKALGAIGGETAAHALAARLPDKDDRLYAKAALIKMGPVAEEYVLPLVGDSNDDVHDAACDIVGEVGTNKSLSKLRALRRESSTRRRLSVSGAIHDLEQRLVKKR